METSPQTREAIGSGIRSSFRVLTGLIALLALLFVAVEFVDPIAYILDGRGETIPPLGWLVIVSTPTGWSGLIYACWIRPGRITDRALVFVLSLGVGGMVISLTALVARGEVPQDQIPLGMVFLTGTWLLNALGIAWIVHTARRIRAASNADGEE